MELIYSLCLEYNMLFTQSQQKSLLQQLLFIVYYQTLDKATLQ